MVRFSRFAFSVALVLICSVSSAQDSGIQDSGTTPPLRVLLVAGGCCHDYATQTQLLKNGIEERINAIVTVVYNPDTTTEAKFEIYESDDWASGYDVVIHDECSANVTEQPYVDRILAAHRGGVPAVNLHCAMHSYRWGDFRKPVETGADNGGWYEMIGVQSTAHGKQSPIDVTYVAGGESIVEGLGNWKTVNEELYNNVRVFGSTEVLATGVQETPAGKKGGKATTSEAAVVWTNQYGPTKTRIFSTTLGHNNETVGDDRYLDLLSRGLLWSTGHLNEHGQPAAGYAK